MSAGKGDDRRPAAVSEDELTWRWALAFGGPIEVTSENFGELLVASLREASVEAKARRIGQVELPFAPVPALQRCPACWNVLSEPEDPLDHPPGCMGPP